MLLVCSQLARYKKYATLHYGLDHDPAETFNGKTIHSFIPLH